MSGVRRSRWAAIGAAVAVSLGAGGLGLARASTGVESSFVSVTPARVLDNRGAGLGLTGPLVSPTPRVLQVTGPIARPNGSTAVVVPPGATAVVLNVTVVGPTAAGFLSVRPDGTPGAPETSNLNFNAGDIIPNAVTVALPASGAIELTYNAFGAVGPTTDVLADVTGYYVAASGGGGATGPALLARIDALEAANSALDAEIVALKAGVATNTSGIATNASSIAANASGVAALDAAQPFAVTARNFGRPVTSTASVVLAVSVTAPVAGQVTVNSTGVAGAEEAGVIVLCSITTGISVDGDYAQGWAAPGGAAAFSQLAGTRTFDIAEGATATYNLVCVDFGSSENSSLSSPVLTAIFTPAP